MSLLDKAAGREAVDLLLTGATVLDVFSGVRLKVPVAIAEGRIVGFGHYEARETLDLSGQVLLPGLIEGHIHLESSMLSPAEFARAVVAHGTTTVVADPHEICNVCGLSGARYLLEAMPQELLNLYLMAPSCVPATHLETAGAEIGIAEIEEMLRWPQVLGLGEVMNFPGVIAGAPEVMAKIAAAQGRSIDGHAPGVSGKDLMAYILAGPQSDHEATTLAEGEEKLEAGMWLMIREGSASRDLSALAPLLRGEGRQRCLLVSDDRCAGDLLQEGHLDHLLRRAREEGISALDAVRAVTINAAQRFGLTDLGAIGPGYRADLVAVSDLDRFEVSLVLKGGQVVARGGQVLTKAVGGAAGPRETCHVPGLTGEMLAIRAPVAAGEVTARIIVAIEGQLVTAQTAEKMTVREGEVAADPSRDLLKIAVIERHGRSGSIGLGFVRGLGLKSGALASTVAHDSHNLIVAGCDDESMLTAARAVVSSGGGQAVAVGSRLLAALLLPLGGLMSDLPLVEVARRAEELRAAAAQLGCPLSQPFMTLSFLALPVIPELKMTDQGLVDVTAFQHVSLFA